MSRFQNNLGFCKFLPNLKKKAFFCFWPLYSQFYNEKKTLFKCNKHFYFLFAKGNSNKNQKVVEFSCGYVSLSIYSWFPMVYPFSGTDLLY